MKTRILIVITFLTGLFTTLAVAQSGRGLVTSTSEDLNNARTSAAQKRGCINFTITNIRSDKGLFYIAFYKQPSTFLKNHGESLSIPVTPNGRPEQNAEVCDLEPGWYAVAVMQDLDLNGTMNFNILGMPREPYGFSNGMHPLFRAPRFKECSFYIQPGAETNVNVSLINP